MGAEEKAALKKQLEGGGVQARLEVLQRLEEVANGTLNRLQRIWTAYGRQTIFLWGTNSFRSFTAAQVRRALLKAVGRAEPGVTLAQLEGDWHRIVHDPEPEQGKPRVLRVRLAGDELGATIRLTKTHYYVYEDEEREYPLTYDVNLTVDLSTEGKVARVFGAQHEGKRSMRTFLEWLFQQELPTRRADLDEYMAPIHFAEKHVKALARQSSLKLECVGMEGPDPQGVVGKVGFEGKALHYHLHPLDRTDDRVKAQEAVAQDARSYNFTFTHPEDGFVEKGRVAFYFKAQQPNLSFLVRSSQSAVTAVVNALHAVVR